MNINDIKFDEDYFIYINEDFQVNARVVLTEYLADDEIQ